MKHEISSIFPNPVYCTHRDLDLNSTEKKEIEDIIEEGMRKNENNSSSNNTYIFNTKLYNLKEFCEQHIKLYVEEIINPKEELNFYITQSWLNVTKPSESHHSHFHSNSIISGVYYISTVKDDSISFYDPNFRLKQVTKFDPKSNPTLWTAEGWSFPVEKNKLVLFPSWILHGVEQNQNAITDRISISFNVFAKGIFGNKNDLNELIL